MTLQQAIEQAQASNEKKLAAEVPATKQSLDNEALSLLRHFAEWCKAHGVKFCPAAPATVAAFIRNESAIGVHSERIVTALRAIEVAHDNQGFANPVACAAPREELGRILNLDAPRSWPKADRALFNALPIEVQAVIKRRSDQDSKEIRRLQEEAAEIRKHQRKEITNGSPDQKAD